MANEVAVVNDSIQYIVVGLGNEQYGIDIKYIDNIVRMTKITRVPKVQPYFRGVINLRGEVVPVMSLRLKMNLDDDEITNKSRIIILKTESNANIGILVDEVKKVVTISNSDVERMSHDRKNGNQTFISGVGKVEEGLISLLDLSMIIDDEE
ncbi:MAG: chemotaxis protein CheW [Lachnospiraceae bacterium]|nr:chemotaxis protein CheW [Lachnospiraceae bacterium]MDN4744036.1 chemotaxis protein CheW [Lachnospiraceae bacterium C1.1]